MLVRPLKKTDLGKVMVVAKWLHQNSRYKVFTFKEDKVLELLATSLVTDSPVFVWVAVQDDQIIGYFHGYVDYHYFSDMKYAGEWAVCILPQYRRSAPKVLKQFILAFEQWGRKNGAEEISIGASTEAYGTGYKKFLKRMGYRDVGFLAVKG
jgi:hypothetical protein